MYDKALSVEEAEEAKLCFRHFDETFSYLEAIIKSIVCSLRTKYGESKVSVGTSSESLYCRSRAV